MNMKDIESEVREIVWLPTLSHTEKAERLLLLMNCAYALGYEQGKNDTKEVLLKAIYENI